MNRSFIDLWLSIFYWVQFQYPSIDRHLELCEQFLSFSDDLVFGFSFMYELQVTITVECFSLELFKSHTHTLPHEISMVIVHQRHSDGIIDLDNAAKNDIVNIVALQSNKQNNERTLPEENLPSRSFTVFHPFPISFIYYQKASVLSKLSCFSIYTQENDRFLQSPFLLEGSLIWLNSSFPWRYEKRTSFHASSGLGLLKPLLVVCFSIKLFIVCQRWLGAKVETFVNDRPCWFACRITRVNERKQSLYTTKFSLFSY